VSQKALFILVLKDERNFNVIEERVPSGRHYGRKNCNPGSVLAVFLQQSKQK